MKHYSFAEAALALLTPLRWCEATGALVVDRAALAESGARYEIVCLMLSQNPRKPSPTRAGIQAGSAIALLGLRYGARRHKLYIYPCINGAPC